MYLEEPADESSVLQCSSSAHLGQDAEARTQQNPLTVRCNITRSETQEILTIYILQGHGSVLT
jgi:hypothetical protein